VKTHRQGREGRNTNTLKIFISPYFSETFNQRAIARRMLGNIYGAERDEYDYKELKKVGGNICPSSIIRSKHSYCKL